VAANRKSTERGTLAIGMFAHVLEAMVDAVFVLDNNGNISTTNHAARSLTGYTAQELRGRPAGSIIQDDQSGLDTAVRERINGGNTLRRDEAWLIPKSDSRTPISLTASPVVTPDGELQGIVLVARDMRQLRRLLAEKEGEIRRRYAAETELEVARAAIAKQLDEARDQLVLAERRATLGTLAGGVGHELRNMAMIQTVAIDNLREALDRRNDLKTVVAEVLPGLHKVAEHVTLHGRRLLQLARPGPDHREPLDLTSVIRDVVQMLEGAGKLRGITTELDLGARAVMVTVNRTRIEQIIVNLIANASDALAGSGTIAIDVKLVEDRATVRIRDTGPGIPPDVLPHVFEPFFTTKPEQQGTGLGLSVVSEIVRSYGGSIVVDSAIGSGATFVFDLPASEPAG
jgi:PAS domain S-box-containing protein